MSTSKPSHKRARFSSESSSQASRVFQEENPLALATQKKNDDSAMEDNVPDELFPRTFERLSLSIDPNYVKGLVDANIVGFNRPVAQRLPTLRYYQINVVNFRNTINNLVTGYLRRKLYESETMTTAQVDAEVLNIVPVITNACMAALYARLRTIHTQFQTYTGRFAARPSYTKDIELPLPLADAIQNFGVFAPLGLETNLLCIPVYPENIQNEGRSTQVWNSFDYESYLPVLTSLNIPVKSVDTRNKFGTPWWAYKVNYVDDHFDLRCIYPPRNYSNHTALLASMFARQDDEGEPIPIIQHLADDTKYPVRLREAPDGFQLRAFGALCHAPCEEWSQYAFISE